LQGKVGRGLQLPAEVLFPAFAAKGDGKAVEPTKGRNHLRRSALFGSSDRRRHHRQCAAAFQVSDQITVSALKAEKVGASYDSQIRTGDQVCHRFGVLGGISGKP
jgi:hypothetical protein